MGDLLHEIFDLLQANLGPATIAMAACLACLLFSWHKHLQVRLLRERLDFEKERRDAFVNGAMEAQRCPPAKSANPSGSSGERILVVDDEECIRKMLQCWLVSKHPSIQVDSASDGKEAMQTIEANPPSIIITDFRMPNMDGIELVRELRKKGIRIPTLVVSGFSSEQLFPALLTSGGIVQDDSLRFLAKPFRTEDLEQAIATLKQSVKK